MFHFSQKTSLLPPIQMTSTALLKNVTTLLEDQTGQLEGQTGLLEALTALLLSNNG